MPLLCRLLALAALLVVAGCDDDNSGMLDLATADLAVSDAGTCAPGDMSHCLAVDDAGVSHGCVQGGMGPGDRDDGGGAPAVGPDNDLGADLTNLPFGSLCLDNGQCSSNICFSYRVKGQFCTQLCNCNADCPPSSLGCSGQGVCRVGM